MLMLSSNTPLALAGTRLDRPMPVLGNLIKPHTELAGKGLSISGLTEKDAPIFGAIAGSYRFKYANHKVHKISLLEKANMLCHSSGQGFTTFHSDTIRLSRVFFYALFRVLSFGRGGISTIKNPLRERLMRRSMAVVNTLIAFTSIHFTKTIGGHDHA